jgi:hypothetical protein
MAERVLVNRIITRVPMSRCIPGDIAVADETMRLYDAGMVAERELPPFYLPIVCASRESTPIFLEAHMPGYLASRSGRHRVSSRGAGSNDGSSCSGSGSGSSAGPGLPSRPGISSCVRRSAEELQVRKSLLNFNGSSNMGDSSSASSRQPEEKGSSSSSSTYCRSNCRKGRVAAAAAAAAAGVHTCSRCSVQASNMKKCSGCSAHYCSIDCQMADWHAGHKKSCERSFFGKWFHKFF